MPVEVKELGKQAACLLAYLFAENWTQPIINIQAELGVVSKGKPSKRSEKETAKVLIGAAKPPTCRQ